MSSKVKEVALFGKKPIAGKVVLDMSLASNDGARREVQLSVREAIRTGLPESWWATIDKPPDMRQISKAVAKMSGFLESKLGCAQKNLVLGSWPQARAFLGKTESYAPMP